MTHQAELPDILVLTALSPAEQDGELYSPKLLEKVAEYDQSERDMWDGFWVAESGSLAELDLGRKLADYYQLKTAAKLQNDGRDKLLWTERFNQAGAEIYGEINPVEVARIAVEGLPHIKAGLPLSRAANFYSTLAAGIGREVATKQPEKLVELRLALFNFFPEIAEVFGELPEGSYDSVAVREVFSKILGKLSEKDSAWAEWNITNTAGKTMLSVVAPKKEIDVPAGREPVAGKQELLSLEVNEIGGHARHVGNGAK